MISKDENLFNGIWGVHSLDSLVSAVIDRHKTKAGRNINTVFPKSEMINGRLSSYKCIRYVRDIYDRTIVIYTVYVAILICDNNIIFFSIIVYGFDSSAI